MFKTRGAMCSKLEEQCVHEVVPGKFDISVHKLTEKALILNN